MRIGKSWCTAVPLPAESLRELRNRAIFECCKWDPQVEDVDTLAPMAVILDEAAWHELAKAAEDLSAETITLERELLHRPELHRVLAIPRAIRSVLSEIRAPRNSHDVRVMRFDFHPTAEGWRVTEVNSDVPGGYNEASGWTSLVAEVIPDAVPCADPAQGLIEAIAKRPVQNGAVALVHATAYTDDRQVMTFLGQKLRRIGLSPVLVAPDHIRWRNGLAGIESNWYTGPVDFIFRFYPAEWLPNLGRKHRWAGFFEPGETPLCNPGTALFTQSKRWRLVCHHLKTDTPAWDKFMPETRDPREVNWQANGDWVIKPALGRVGELVGVKGITEPTDWNTILRSTRWWGARHWVAQKRFEPIPLHMGGQTWHICIGVYTVAGRAAGIYGRVADKPLINHRARDVAVLVQKDPHEYLRAV